jgi:hypothetical protein
MYFRKPVLLALALATAVPAGAEDSPAAGEEASPYRFTIDLTLPQRCDVSAEDTRSGAKFGVIVMLRGNGNESEYENGDTGQKLRVSIEPNAIGGSTCTATMYEGGEQVAREVKSG